MPYVNIGGKHITLCQSPLAAFMFCVWYLLQTSCRSSEAISWYMKLFLLYKTMRWVLPERVLQKTSECFADTVRCICSQRISSVCAFRRALADKGLPKSSLIHLQSEINNSSVLQYFFFPSSEWKMPLSRSILAKRGVCFLSRALQCGIGEKHVAYTKPTECTWAPVIFTSQRLIELYCCSSRSVELPPPPPLPFLQKGLLKV